MSVLATQRVSRPVGKGWRRKMFAALIERDGCHCAQCKEPGLRFWRKCGPTSYYTFTADAEPSLCSPVRYIWNLEVDHRTPLSEGGDNDINNLWLLCIDCHKRKTTAERSARLKRLFAEARA